MEEQEMIVSLRLVAPSPKTVMEYTIAQDRWQFDSALVKVFKSISLPISGNHSMHRKVNLEDLDKITDILSALIVYRDSTYPESEASFQYAPMPKSQDLV